MVKGKTKPVGIYEILDYHTEQSFPNIVEVLSHFRDGLSNYRRQQWDEAMMQFRGALELNPGDKPSRLYSGALRNPQAKPSAQKLERRLGHGVEVSNLGTSLSIGTWAASVRGNLVLM